MSATLQDELAALAEREAEAERIWAAGKRRFDSGEPVKVKPTIKPHWSLMHGCHASEVRLLKKIVGTEYESCVHDDGSVRFRNAAQAKGYAEKMAEARMLNEVQPGCFLNERAQARDREIAAQRAAGQV